MKNLLIIGLALLFFGALTGGCANQSPHINLVGDWEVVAIDFPDNPAGQAVEKETEKSRSNLRYSFKNDSSYVITSDKLETPVEGDWRTGDEMNTFFWRTGREIAILMRCERQLNVCKKCITCAFYNPELGEVTLHMKSVRK